MTQSSTGALSLEGLNDANGIFVYKGVLHVMCQGVSQGSIDVHCCAPRGSLACEALSVCAHS
jgi:hypothetical protein